MIIYQPEKILKDNEAVVKAAFEIDGKKHELWFSFPKEYEQYLVTENADAFLVGLLLLAMKKGEDVEVKAPISEKLYYQLSHYAIKALNLANEGWREIKIKASSLNGESLCPKAIAGAALTCGVDSFATVIDHLQEAGSFEIKYFTFHNSGGHGHYGGDKSRKIFKDRLGLVEGYAKEVGKGVIAIDTNLNEILEMAHRPTHTIRDVACILNLQKLFRYYFYSASLRFDYFVLSNFDMAHYEILLLSLLSTESTTFYSGASQYTRVERTMMITDYPPTYKYLNVCIAQERTGLVENCSVCIKCLRTELTLDLLNKLECYKDVFDLKEYRKKKESFVERVLSEKDIDLPSHQEIYNLIETGNPYNREIYHLIRNKDVKR